MRHVVGRHIYLNCSELEAAEILTTRIEDIILLFEHHDDLFIIVSKEGMKLTYPNQTWDA